MSAPRRALPLDESPLGQPSPDESRTIEARPVHSRTSGEDASTDQAPVLPVPARETVAYQVNGTDFAAAPAGRHARRVAAPLAVVIALASTISAGVLLPTGADDATKVTPLPSIDRGQSQVSRDLLRPSLSDSLAATPAASASVTPSASPTPTPAATATPTPAAPSSPTPAAAKPSAAVKPSASTKPAAAKPSTQRASRATQGSTSTRTKAQGTRPAASSQVAPALGRVVGTRYTTGNLNVRSLPSAESARLRTLVEGSAVKVTSKTSGSFRQVSVNGRAGWVLASYLDSSRPAVESKQATAEGSSSPSKQSSTQRSSTANRKTSTSSTSTKSTTRQASTAKAASGGSCSRGAGPSGITSRTRGVYRAVCANFPAISSYGGYRPGDGGEHGQGRALDVMVSGQSGWALARWARANAASLGISEVIFAQQIWTTERAGDGWRPMSDRGSSTANHFDHVHITVR